MSKSIVHDQMKFSEKYYLVLGEKKSFPPLALDTGITEEHLLNTDLILEKSISVSITAVLERSICTKIIFKKKSSQKPIFGWKQKRQLKKTGSVALYPPIYP